MPFWQNSTPRAWLWCIPRTWEVARYGSDVSPESEPGAITDNITGVLIDVSEFKDFIPALEPRVLSEHGRLIYGATTASRRCAVDMGVVSYHTSREQAMKDKRLGFAPYYLFAAGVTGAGRSDVFLDMNDITRITGSEGGRKALSRCAVAFLVRKK
ncbi:MAG: hypothetical protein HY042_05875 [Spirochaetia bacterium]|nr:hypothetical protein [Spirochaetia bacterium]